MWFFQFTLFLLVCWLTWSVFYQLFFSIMGHFVKKTGGKSAGPLRKFLVLIPAYKADAVIAETTAASLTLDYPIDLFKVVVIADQLKPETEYKLQRTGASVLHYNEPTSSKSKAINAALANAPADFDAVAILDADNQPAPDFLTQINAEMNRGYRAVQGCRVSKNEDSAVALLDGASEAINNHILCSGHKAVGLSARLAGSGMAFEYPLFKKIMAGIDALGGFDKELELKLTQQKVAISFAPDAVIFDEKVSKFSHFTQQRGRWIAAQYRYGRRFAFPAIMSLIKTRNFDFFNKTAQMALPPRLILPGILATLVTGSWLIGSDFLQFASLSLAANLASFALAIPKSMWKKKFIFSLFQLPLAFFAALKSLALLPKANKEFLHTPHMAIQRIPIHPTRRPKQSHF